MSTQFSIQDTVANAFGLDALENRRLTWVDYLRGIAIILVVYHHVRVGIERSHIVIPEVLVNANMVFYSFRMPLFFLLSGIFICRSLGNKTAKQLSWIKFENLLYPYLLWSFIQVTLQIVLSNFTNSDRNLTDYSYIIYQPRRLDQFWYLPALFNATMVFLFIKKMLRPSLLWHITIGMGFYILSPLIAEISMISDWMAFYIFFALGHVFSNFFFEERAQRFFKSPMSLLLIIPVFIAAQVFYLKYEVGQHTLAVDAQLSGTDYVFRIINQVYFLLIALVGCLAVFILSFRLEKWNRFTFLRVLGMHSLYIYVMHVMVVAFIRALLVHVIGIENPVVLLVAGIFFGTTLPIIFYNLTVRDGPLWFLFCLHKRSVCHLAPSLEPAPAITATKRRGVTSTQGNTQSSTAT